MARHRYTNLIKYQPSKPRTFPNDSAVWKPAVMNSQVMVR